MAVEYELGEALLMRQYLVEEIFEQETQVSMLGAGKIAEHLIHSGLIDSLALYEKIVGEVGK